MVHCWDSGARLLQPVPELFKDRFREALRHLRHTLFLVAQVVAKLQFHQPPSRPIYVGEALVVAGGLVMTFWKA